MRTIIQLCSKLKYIGLLGFPMFFSDLPIWKYMWLFWLFGVAEILLTLPTFMQQILQIVGMIVTGIKRGGENPEVEPESKIEYSLPFHGEWLVLNGGVNKELSHSWEIYPQRYAYDFVMVDDEVKTYAKDPQVVSNYYCYGQDVIAPADGVVVQVGHTCEDSRIMPNAQTDPLIKDIRGNFVVIKHYEGEYSLLAHLQPKSISVKVGDAVVRGMKIAQCGNTGNTSEPHLHFQVQTTTSFYISEGIKIRFKGIERRMQPNYEVIDPREVVKDDNFYEENEYIHRGMLVHNKM